MPNLLKKIGKSSLFQKFVKPIVANTLDALYTGLNTKEIYESFKDVINPTLPIGKRVIAGIKGSCCGGAMLTAYRAKKTKNPSVTASLRTYSVVFTTAYGLMGGNTQIILLNAAVLKKDAK